MGRRSATETTVVTETEPPSNGTSPPPTTGGAVGDLTIENPTLAARRKEEEHKENVKTALRDKVAENMAAMGITGPGYYHELSRTYPPFFTRKDGVTVNCLGYLQTYPDDPATKQEIQQTHGDGKYQWITHGPDPQTGRKRTWKTVIPEPIIDPEGPKTYSAPGMGARPITEAQATNTIKSAEDATVMTKMLEMVSKMIESSEARMEKSLERLAQKPGADNTQQIEIMKLQHDEKMQQLKRESEERSRQETARIEAEKLRIQAEKDAREIAEKERQRQHELELKRIEADAKKAEAAESTRREELKAQREAEAARQEKMVERFEATIERLGRKDTDPLDGLLKLDRLYERFSGKGNKGTDTGEIVTQVLKSVDAKADLALKTWLSSKEKDEKKTRDKKPFKEQTVVAVEPPQQRQLPPQTQVPASSSAPAPDFVFPNDETIPADALKMLGENVERALKANWPTPRIYEEVVKKFPETLLALMRSFDIDTWFSTLDEHAPEDAVLKKPRGRQAIRIMHGLLTDESEG